jgi:hypothetical protein
MEYGLSNSWGSEMTMDSEALLDSEKTFDSEGDVIELFSYLFQNLPFPSLLLTQEITARIITSVEVTACKPIKIQM